MLAHHEGHLPSVCHPRQPVPPAPHSDATQIRSEALSFKLPLFQMNKRTGTCWPAFPLFSLCIHPYAFLDVCYFSATATTASVGNNKPLDSYPASKMPTGQSTADIWYSLRDKLSILLCIKAQSTSCMEASVVQPIWFCIPNKCLLLHQLLLINPDELIMKSTLTVIDEMEFEPCRTFLTHLCMPDFIPAFLEVSSNHNTRTSPLIMSRITDTNKLIF